MADWVHCNVCFRQPRDGLQFSLTNCGHIYCGGCVGASTGAKCKVCGASRPTTITLSDKMKPDVELFFTDPVEISKKHHKQLLQVMDFQKNHRLRLTAHRMGQLKQGSESRKNIENAFKELEKICNSLKEENNYLKKLINGSDASFRSSPINQLKRKSPAPPGTQFQAKTSPCGHMKPTPSRTITTSRLSIRTPPKDLPSPNAQPYSASASNLPSQRNRTSPMSTSPWHSGSSMPAMTMPITPNAQHRPATPNTENIVMQTPSPTGTRPLVDNAAEIKIMCEKQQSIRQLLNSGYQ